MVYSLTIGEANSRRLVVVWLLCFCCLLGIPRPSLGQSDDSNDFEVVRVYIPESEQAKLIPSDYRPINNDELYEKLRLEKQRRQAAEFDKPALSEAIYVARIQGSLLESKNSRWRLVGLPGEEYVPIGKTSLTIQDPTEQPNDLNLLNSCYFSPDGQIQVEHTTRVRDYWFGFKKRIDSKFNKLDFEVPPASIARLLIAAPTNVSLASEQVPVVKVDSLDTLLPGDWKADSIASMESSPTTVQWWSVNLAGVSNCSLSVEVEPESPAGWQRIVASSADYAFTVRPNSVDVVAGFSLINRAQNERVRLKLSKNVRVKSIMIDDRPTDWIAIPSLSKQHQLVEFALVDANQITVVASSREDSDQGAPALVRRLRLPEVTLTESLVLSGRSTVRCSDSLLLLSVEESGNRASGPSEGLQVDPDMELESLVWKDTWIGQPPVLTLSTERRAKRWRVEGITKVTAQPGSLSAVSTLRIDSPRTSLGLDSNELRIPIGGNWLLDDVRLIGESPDLQISRFETAVEDISRGESGRFVVISWSELRDGLSIQLEAKAHQPLVLGRDAKTLDTSVLLALPDGEHDLNYVLSIREGLQLLPSTELLSARLEVGDLPAWQRSILKNEVDEFLVFDAVGSSAETASLPSVAVASVQGTLSTQLATVVKPNATEYRIICKPVSGPIAEVPIVLPVSDGAADLPTFTLIDEVTQIPTSLETTSRLLSESQLEVVLKLPESTSRPFEIRSSRPNVFGSELRKVELWAVPKASSAKSTLIIPRDLAAISGQPTLELLPTRSCCSSEELAKLKLDFNEQNLSRLLAARVDASIATSLELYPTLDSSKRGWVWEEVILHRIGPNKDTHSIQWDIERNDLMELSIFIPEAWSVNRVQVEENDVEFESIDSPRGLLLALPDAPRVRVSVEFVSESSSGWIAKHQIDTPRLELPIHERFEQVVLPANRVEVEGSIAQDASGLLLKRLMPSQWWSWLSPAQEAKTRVSQAVIRSHGQEIEIWTIESAAVSTVLICILLASAAVWFLLCRSVYSCVGVAGGLLSLLILSPLQFTPYLQTVLLGLALSAMARFICFLSLLPTLRRGRESSMTNGSTRNGKTTIPAASIGLLIFLGSQANVLAQIGIETSEETKKGPSLYGVLTPVDESEQMSGQTVYISPDLEKLLSGTNGGEDAVPESRILSADYVFRITKNDEVDTLPDVTLEVEFDLLVDQADQGIEIPFSQQQLELDSIRVQGQERLINSQSQSSSSIRFEAPVAGVVQLQLGFSVLEIDRTVAGALAVRAQIPITPNATLRIVSDDQNNEFEVVGAGDIQKFVNGELFTDIGPIDTLDISWVESDDETLQSRETYVQVDTWVHATGTQPLAICQMQIDPATLISTSEIERDTGRRAIRVTTNGEWDVVGVSWGNSFLDNPSSYLFGSRRVYTIELKDPQEIRNRAMDPTNARKVVMRVVMVPNNLTDETSVIGIPFLKIAQQPTGRRFGWTADESSPWRFDGLEFQEVASIIDWGGLKLGAIQWGVGRENVKLFKVPILGAGALQIRRSTMPASETEVALSIQEQTRLHVGVFSSRYEYSASYAVPNRPLGVSANEDIQFELPIDAVLTKAEVNGESAEIVRLNGEGSNRYVLISGKSSGPKVLSVDFVRPTRLGVQLPLSKPSFSEASVSSSEYEIFAASGVICDISGPQVLISTDESSSEVDQLESLERRVAVLELLPEERNEQDLGTRMLVSAAPNFSPTETLLTLSQDGDEWFADFTMRYLNDDKQSEFAFIEIPYSVRDIISFGSTPRAFLPALNTNRVVLCVLPKSQLKDESGRSELSFRFRLDSAGSAQTLRIPQIQVLGADSTKLKIVVPQQVDGQSVLWSGNIRKLEVESSILADDAVEYFIPSEQDSQLTYQFLEKFRRSARVIRKSLWLRQWSEQGASGIASYWLEPQGQLSQEFQLPSDATITGVQVEGSPAVWRQEGDSVYVTLQPNYLAVEVRLIVQLGPSLTPPVVIADSQPDRSTLFLSPQENLLMRVLPSAPTQTDKEFVTDAVKAWVEVVVETLRPDSRVAKEELALWASNWKPQAKGIEATELVSDSQLLTIPWVEAPSQVDLNQDGQVQVLELWKDLVSEAGLDGLVELSNPPLSSELGNANRNTMPDDSSLQVIAIGSTTPTDARLAAACLVALASTLFLILVYRLRQAIDEILLRHVWSYWALLAMAMWIFLPIAWPAYFMGIVATGMVVTQTVVRR